VIGHNYMRERLSDGRWLSTCLRCGKQTKRRFRTSRIWLPGNVSFSRSRTGAGRLLPSPRAR